jgi:predicted RNase H-like HicB family nuclease
MRYKVRLHESEEGYAIWCPSLPGCWSQGETKEEALENIKDAMKKLQAELLETVDA